MKNHYKNSGRKSLIAVSVLVIALTVAGGYWLATSQAPKEPASPIADTGPATDTTHKPVSGATDDKPAASGASTREPPEIVAQTPVKWPDKPLSRSLEGTEIDGRLRAGSNGHLVVDLQVKDFFDYFLSAVGQVSPEEAIGAITAMAKNNLPEPAASEAITLLDSYLDYKRQALAMSQMRLDPERQSDPDYQLTMLRQALTNLKALRRNTLSPEAAHAFFAKEEAYSEYTLATMEIQRRGDLTPEARQTLLAFERQKLPAGIRHTENALRKEAKAGNARQAAINEAESPADAGKKLRALGMEGKQVDDVVTYLDERQSFKTQYDEYQQDLQQIDTAGLAPEDRAKQREKLLAEHFRTEQQRTWARLRELDGGSGQ